MMAERNIVNPKQIIKGLAAAVFCGFAVFYMYRQVIGIRRDTVETETALAISLENTLSSSGYIVRCETVLKTDLHGSILSVVEDGEKVACGMEVANIYPSDADTGVKARMDEIDRQLRILESSTVDQEFFSADVSKLEKDKNETLDLIGRSKTKNDFSDCVGKKTQLLIRLNKLYTVTSGVSFEPQIEALKQERIQLAARSGTSYTRVFSPVSGYYNGIVDGYETLLSPEELDELTYDDFVRITESAPDETLLSGNAGKIVTDSRWYVLCSFPRSDTASFETGNSYTVVFPYASGVTVSMRLYRLISETDKTQDILIFTTNEMPEGFTYTRSQKIQVVSRRYEGLKIPKSAMRMLPDGTKGVYVLVGNVVRFKRAEEIHQFDESYIIRYASDEEKNESALTGAAESSLSSDGENASTNAAVKSDESSNPPDGNTEKPSYPYLSLYDNVIVSGKELYDGKRIG